MYAPSAPHLMITQPVLFRPTPISRNLSVASSIDSFDGGSGSDKSDKASSEFGLHISDEFILIARGAPIRLTYLKIDIDLRTEISSSSSSGTQQIFEGQNKSELFQHDQERRRTGIGS